MNKSTEKTPSHGRFVWIEAVLQDVRYSIRTLRKQALSNGVVVLTIALLIGAASVLHTAVRDDLMGVVPFPEPESMVEVWRVSESHNALLFPPPIFLDYREKLGAFEHLGAVKNQGRMTLTEIGEPVQFSVVGVTEGLLAAAGLKPIRGRLFDAQDYANEADRIVLISEQMWRETLGADTNIVGRELRLDGQTYQVAGIMPAEMRTTKLAWNVDVWLPTRVNRNDPGFKLRLFGRLKPGVSRRQAQAELSTLAPRLEQQHTPSAAEKKWYPKGFKTARVAPITEWMESPSQDVRDYLLWAKIFRTAIMTCVVGIACFNITNLLLARHGARSREIGIRLSLGANRLRIMQQLLTETLLLAFLGGGLGLLASFWIADLLRFQHVKPEFDGRLYLMAFFGTLLLGLVVGLVPAIRSSRKDLSECIKEGGATTGGVRRHRLRNFLVSSEVAMATVLCVVAGLMTRGFLEFYRDDLGFEPDQLVSVRVQLPPDRYPSRADQITYVERGLQALREMPGVDEAVIFEGYHLQGAGAEDAFSIPGGSGDEEQIIQAVLSPVGPEFPDLVGMPVLRGRGLPEKGNPGSGEVLVNELFVERYFPAGDAVGREIRTQSGRERLTIAGIVRNRHTLMTLKQLEPEVFRDYRESPTGHGCEFLVRTRGNARVAAPLIRATLCRLDANQPVSQPVIVSDLADRKVAGARKSMINLGFLAGIGLLIAVTGVYGVVSFSVVERTREVGIRLALGATRRSILGMMLWQGARLMFIGVPIGILLGTQVMSFFPTMELPGDLSPQDIPTYLGVLLCLGLIGLGASLFPARRATRIVPMEALRHE